MSPATLALAATQAPLVAFAVAILFLRQRHAASAAVVLAGGATSLACSVLLLAAGPQEAPLVRAWLASGDLQVAFGFLLDGPSLLMGAVVGLIAFAVQVYSVGYMAHDEGRGRYFAFMALFEWSMLSFVYASSLLQTFIFWELVGLASFLLIGFWYRKPAAVAAAKKAFIMTRLGDVGLFIGLILLLDAAGTLDIATLNAPATVASLDPERLTLLTLLLFSGVVGKSAQFPLHTWLPDAMEGPTPVSALLHSATMVAAGVFLVARFHPLFLAAPTTLAVMLTVAAVTILLSATMAMVSRDIKRVLAYSSIGQLGYMLLGLASGSLFAGLFHLTTHAVFKALLFLCAGAYIHQTGSNDLVAIGRAGGRAMRGTTLGLVVGGGALAGLPPLAGFFSKEHVLHEVGAASSLALAAAWIGAFLTAYYTFRMIFLVVRPDPASAAVPEAPADPSHAHGHGPDAPWAMRGPILVLAALAVAAGFSDDALARLLGVELAHPALSAMVVATAVALAGVAVAWLDFGRAGAAQRGFVARVPALERLFADGWRLDAFYRAVILRAYAALSGGAYALETRGLDGGADRVAGATVGAGGAASRAQAGVLQLAVATAVVTTAVLALYLLYRRVGG